jgi:RimJ/RimL family protein N-acetyltransferase
MENINKLNFDEKKITPIVKDLRAFDMEYFKELEGGGGWLALGGDDYQNQKYFTVYSDKDEKLGIVGVFDTENGENFAHTVVDPKYRGQGLATKFKDRLMNKLGLEFLTLTVSLGNTSSIKAIEKLPGVEKVSDEKYEKEFNKAKYIYKKPKND